MKKKSKKSERETMSFNLDPKTKQRLRCAVYHTPGLTLDGVAELALNYVVDELEKKRGEKFPKKPVKLHPGRPIKIGDI
jgi:hypothetical protein